MALGSVSISDFLLGLIAKSLHSFTHSFLHPKDVLLTTDSADALLEFQVSSTEKSIIF